MNLISLLGPTSSGKSEMAIDLAKNLKNKGFRVWVVGCDSRQVYKFLNLGTGKIPGSWQSINTKQLDFYPNKKIFFYKNIPHFLIDYKNPYKDFQFSLVNFLLDFKQLLIKTKFLPDFVILTGGTGLYAKAILEEYKLTQIKPEFAVQAEQFKHTLEQESLPELQRKYQELNLKQLNQSDFRNPRRLLNKIYQQKIKEKKWGRQIKHPTFKKKLSFAIQTDFSILKQKISDRLEARLSQGMLQEIITYQDLGYKQMLSLGLEYRLGYQFILGMLTKKELLKKLEIENYRYAKRQLTWLKKQDLVWVTNIFEILQRLNLT